MRKNLESSSFQGARRSSAQVCPKQDCRGLRAQSAAEEPYNAFADDELSVPTKQMEEVGRVRDSHLAVECLGYLASGVLFVRDQQVARYKRRFYAVAVAKLLISELEKLGMQVSAVEACRVDALEDELPDRLAHEAAELEEGFLRAGRLEPLDGFLYHLAVVAKFCEPYIGEVADAGIFRDCPGFLTLYRRKVRKGFRARDSGEEFVFLQF